MSAERHPFAWLTARLMSLGARGIWRLAVITALGLGLLARKAPRTAAAAAAVVGILALPLHGHGLDVVLLGALALITGATVWAWHLGPAEPWTWWTPAGDVWAWRDRRALAGVSALIDGLGLGDEEHPTATQAAGYLPADIAAGLPLVCTVKVTDPRVHLDFVTRRVAEAETFVGAVSSDVVPAGPGVYRLTWHRTAVPDPLAALPALSGALPWSGDWRAVPYGTRQDGTPATLKVAETSGTVVGGLPGGGKTAGLTTLLSTLVASDAVQFCVWDGKGGADWAWIEPRAALCNRDDEDRAKVADELENLVQVMRDRVSTMQERRGGSSIWNTGGPSPDLPLIVAVVDECQTFLDATAIPKSDKAAQEIRQRTEAAIATLVRKGRSAGIWVIPTTQKPTSDSLPTTIGSNAASALCLRVKTAEAEKAVLGSAPGPDDPTATALPLAPGYAVVASEDGTREVVRFGYLPEAVAAAHAAAHAHLRRPVLPDTDTEPEAPAA